MNVMSLLSDGSDSQSRANENEEENKESNQSEITENTAAFLSPLMLHHCWCSVARLNTMS